MYVDNSGGVRGGRERRAKGTFDFAAENTFSGVNGNRVMILGTLQKRKKFPPAAGTNAKQYLNKSKTVYNYIMRL